MPTLTLIPIAPGSLTAAEFLRGLGDNTYDLIRDGQCVGDGVSDDTTKLAAALSAAGSTKLLTSPPGKTYKTTGSLTIPAGANVDLRGSTIKFVGSSIRVLCSGAGATLSNLVVDANLQTGSNGVGAEAAGIVCRNVTTKNTKGGQGFYVLGAGATLDAYACASTGHQTNAGSGGFGYAAYTSGVLRTYDCLADTTQLSGFFVDPSAGAGCRIHGRARRCGGTIYGAAGAKIMGASGSVPYLRVDDCQGHGLWFTSSGNDWRIGHVECRDMGLTDENPSAASVNLEGVNLNSFGRVDSYNSQGYGVAITAASHHNNFGSIFVYSAGDPGLHFSGGSHHNFVGDAHIRSATYGCIFGEGLTGSNDDNHIANLYVTECNYGALRIDRGIFNHIGKIVARDSYTTDTTYTGLIDFSTANTTDNVVGFIDHRATGTKPKYVVHFDATAVRNYVMDGFDRTNFVTADVLDSNGGNFVSPALGAGLRT